jgi:SOS-response transcriptional repressor LexA
MELEDVLSRVESRLRALNLSAHAASLAAKKPDAIRNLRRAVRSGDRRGITTETLAALAPVLQTTAAWLLEGVGNERPANTARVVGKIGAGAEILPEFEQIPPDGLFEIEVPFPIPEDTIAFEVEGDSMWPRYDAGDVVICSRQSHDAESVVGSEAAVRTQDGRRYLKRVRRGATPGTFDLESHNAAPIRGVAIEWVAGILAAVRADQWRRLERNLVRSEKKQV